MMKIPDVIIIASRGLRKNMTHSEKHLWTHIKNEGLGTKFLRQKPIRVFIEDSGQERYIIADFYASEYKLIIEIDGEIHQRKEIYDLDREKENILIQRGYRVIRFTNQEIHNDLSGALEKISSLLKKGRYPEGRGDEITRLENFLEQKSELQKLVVIYGPTGAGKTDMSIEIAKYLDTEIISTDSRQIFRGMDIGTGKITEEEKQGVPHHMIDIVNPDEDFSVGSFHSQAQNIMNDLYNQGKIPMLVGGTGLYIDSIIFGFLLEELPHCENTKKYVRGLSADELYKELLELDPDYAAELHPHNIPYLERALEVKLITGKSKKDFRREKKLLYEVLFLTPQGAEGKEEYREWLYNRINDRVEKMFELGAEEEVKQLISDGYRQDDFGMNSIGYREFFPYIQGEITKQELIKNIQQNSRNYAKRQLTWFKKYEVLKKY